MFCVFVNIQVNDLGTKLSCMHIFCDDARMLHDDVIPVCLLPLLYSVGGGGGGTIWSLKIDWLSQKSQSALELYSLEHNNNINSNNNNTPFADRLGAKDINFRKV